MPILFKGPSSVCPLEQVPCECDSGFGLKFTGLHILTDSVFRSIELHTPRLMEFIEGAARLRGNAKALDIWRIETKMEARPDMAYMACWVAQMVCRFQFDVF